MASVDELISVVDDQLRAFQVDAGGMSLREKVICLVEVRRAVGEIGIAVAVEHGLSRRNARDRIRAYLVEHVGTAIDGEELAVISAISEYARRVRELRVEQGYRIVTGNSPDPDAGVNLRPEQYMLTSARPDADAARRWHVANRIRRSDVGSRAKVLEYLLENVGKVVTTEELAYVADDATEFARRVRELRTEDGYAIATKFTGKPDLAPGEYILLRPERIAEPHDRHIPVAVQRAVYERDRHTCLVCGWDVEDWTEEDPRILELHHLDEHRRRGANTEENLVVVCSVCHDDIHAGRVKAPRH